MKTMQIAFHTILSWPDAIKSLVLVAANAAITACLIFIFLPIFQRYALARPNERTSHQAPTPQGGGVAVIVTAMGFFITFSFIENSDFLPPNLWLIVIVSLLLLILGGIDDVKPLPALFRLLFQLMLIAVVLYLLPKESRLFPDTIPYVAELCLTGIALLWFINLVNFMDGIDLITCAEMVPLWITLFLFGLIYNDQLIIILSLCLIGALIGFMPFNWPVARLFLGDVGSLPLGFLSGFALLQFAFDTSLMLALVPAYYYLCDSTLTLLIRLVRGEKIWQAHRSHFYQRACKNGYSVLNVVTMIGALNTLLLLLTISAIYLRMHWNSQLVDGLALIIANIFVLAILFLMVRKSPKLNRHKLLD